MSQERDTSAWDSTPLTSEVSERLLSTGVLKDLPREFRDIATEIEDISGNWNAVEIFEPEPKSLGKEKEAFLEALDRGEDYTPSFTYDNAEKMDLGDSREKLRSLLAKVWAWEPQSKAEALSRRMLESKIEDDLATCDLVDGIRAKDDALVRDALDRKYLSLDDSLLRFEMEQFDSVIQGKVRSLSEDEFVKRLEGRVLNTEEQKAFFEWALRSYGLLRTDDNEIGFRVIVDERIQALDVRHRSSIGPVIAIPAKPLSDKPFTLKDAVVLLDHEIEAHALQTANGQAMFGLRAALTLDDETLYEGLAMRREINAYKTHFGAEDTDLRFYAHAIRSAEQGKSFRQVFDDLYDIHLHLLLKLPLDQELPTNPSEKDVKEARRISWRTTYRVLRGHTDLNNKHAFAMRKDIGYNRGYLLDQKLVENDKGHLNEVATIVPEGLELLEELGVQPEDIVYKYKNLTADLVRALKEDMAHDHIFDIQAFVRTHSEKILGQSEFDVRG